MVEGKGAYVAYRRIKNHSSGGSRTVKVRGEGCMGSRWGVDRDAFKTKSLMTKLIWGMP